ncbi:hypothetical protein EDB85DRAFT_1968105 [Lactarius pseudohatsudake]|nr:hypothetical protein EDB85DRAFT_1968105 [Lactarius pseudohatsudake]
MPVYPHAAVLMPVLVILSNLVRCGISNTPMTIKGVVQARNNRTPPLAIDPGQILAAQNPARKRAYVQNPDDRVLLSLGLVVARAFALQRAAARLPHSSLRASISI